MLVLLLAALAAAPAAAGFDEQLAAGQDSIKEQQDRVRALLAERERRWRERDRFEQGRVPPGVAARIEKEAAELAARRSRAELQAAEASAAKENGSRSSRTLQTCQERLDAALRDRARTLKFADSAYGAVRAALERYLDGVAAELASGRAAPGSPVEKMLADHALLAQVKRRYPRSGAALQLEREMLEAANAAAYPAAARTWAAAAAELRRLAAAAKLDRPAGSVRTIEPKAIDDPDLSVSVVYEGGQPRLVACSNEYDLPTPVRDPEFDYLRKPTGRVCVSAGLRDGSRGGADVPSALANDRSDRLYRESADDYAVDSTWDCVYLAAVRRALSSKP